MYRFSLAESADPRSYVAAGAAAGSDALAIQQALARSTPDYAGLNKVGRNLAAVERVSDAKAELDKKLAEMGANEYASERSLNEQLNKANNVQRFAGKLALTSMLLKDAFKKPREPYKPKPMDYSTLESTLDRYRQAIEQLNIRQQELQERPIISPEIESIEDQISDLLSGASAKTAPDTATSYIATAKPTPKQLYDFYRQQGVPDPQSRGLVVNAIRESGLNPTIRGDAGQSIGLYQWKGPRKSLMQETLGSSWPNWENQARYALNEPNEPGQRYLSMTFNSPLEAANFWTTDFERPADPMREQQRNAEILSTFTF